MKFKKGEMDMTETLTNITEIFDTYETEKKETPRIDAFVDFIKLKRMANAQEKLIDEYIVKDRDIRNGKAVIKGTRITTKELMLITQEAFESKPKNIDKFIKYIEEQYPSIDSIEKIVAGLAYEIKQLNTFKFIITILRNNS